MKKVCGKGCVWWEKFGGQFLADGWPDGFCPCCGAALVRSGKKECEQHAQSRELHIEVSELDSRIAALEELVLSMAERLEHDKLATEVQQACTNFVERDMGIAVVRVLRETWSTRLTGHDFQIVADAISKLSCKEHFVALINAIRNVWLAPDG